MTHASVFSGIGEQWKPIQGYEGKYEVSDMGNVRKVGYGIMLPWKSNSGYMYVKLRNGNERKMHYIHRLVALAFCKGEFAGAVVNHINENKTDNRAVNLEWVSQLANVNHGSALKRLSDTKRNNPRQSKAVEAVDDEGRVVATYPSAQEAARSVGKDGSNIVRCCHNIKHTAGGYHWRYKSKSV